jgi:hypothetical protein
MDQTDRGLSVFLCDGISETDVMQAFQEFCNLVLSFYPENMSDNEPVSLSGHRFGTNPVF